MVSTLEAMHALRPSRSVRQNFQGVAESLQDAQQMLLVPGLGITVGLIRF